MVKGVKGFAEIQECARAVQPFVMCMQQVSNHFHDCLFTGPLRAKSILTIEEGAI